MKFKRGVDPLGVHPDLWAILGEIDHQHRKVTGRELVVTSLRRRLGPRPTKHATAPRGLVTAGDLRRHFLDAVGTAPIFCRKLQTGYGRYIGVVLEPEWLTPEEIKRRGGLKRIAPHIHIQLKRTRWPRTS